MKNEFIPKHKSIYDKDVPQNTNSFNSSIKNPKRKEHHTDYSSEDYRPLKKF